MILRSFLLLCAGYFVCVANSSATCPAVIPTPTNLTATTVSPFRITLNWMSSTDSGEYLVQRSPNGTNDWVTIAAFSFEGTNDLQLTDKTLPGGMTFFYRVQGAEMLEICGACCTSEFSNVASATTPAGPVACPLEVRSLRTKLFFSRPDSDQLQVRATVCLPADFDVPNVAGTLQVCDSQLPFILDHVGMGVYVFQEGSGLLHYSRRLHAWRFRAIYNHAQLSQDVSACGLINANIPAPGVPVILPVTVQIGDQSFPGQITVRYSAIANDRGFAR
jgi:hypothetical protein